MPTKAKHPCVKPGCNELITDGSYCDKHKSIRCKQYDKQRGSSSERGYDARWRKAREFYLSKYPLCVQCLENDKVISATVIDHKIAHKGNKSLFWDMSNWQSLCKQCHDRKTAAEDGGFGNGHVKSMSNHIETR